ncbi:MAG: DNA-deoxyinosine glycosylase [Firmicutes bacterium]|nr:DNA-deoxyinosine glycosylase [Bacillota bacterium]
MNIKKGLEPIVENKSKILILGSLPGDQSILNQRYYDNKNNHFWKLISFVFENKFIEFEDYSQKIAFLKRHNIALWDVIKCANRIGSLDSNIANEEYNDLKSLLDNYSIKYIYVNGRKAEDSFKKYLKMNNLDLNYKYLPSSSSLNAKYSLNEKAFEWRKIIKGY